MKPRGGYIGAIGGNLVVWGYALLIVGPMAWVVSNSFKRQIDILMGHTIAPMGLGNYRNIIAARQSEFLVNLGNSAIIAIIATSLVLAIATMAAFTLVRLRAPRWVTWLVMGWALLFHMLPTLTFVGSWYVMFAAVGLQGSYVAIILTHMVHNLPLALFLMAGFVAAIPNELVQAARMDGCNSAQAFRHVVLPLLRGGMAATGALIFIFSWSDFAIALNLSGRDTMTAPVAISTFAQEYEIRYGEMAAASVLSMIPALVLILFGQKFVVRGLLAGAVK